MKFTFLKKIDSHSYEILSKGAVAFALQIIGAGFAFLFQIAIARYLGASGSGVYFLALTIITIAAMLARFGMDNSVTRFVAAYASENNWAKVKGVMRYAIRITLVASLAASITLTLSADWMATTMFGKPELSTPLRLMSIFVVPLALVTIYAKALQGLKRARDSMLMQSVITPMMGGVALLVLAPVFNVSGAVVAYGVGVIFSLAFGFWMWQRSKANQSEICPDFSVRVLIAASSPLLVAGLLELLMLTLPLLLLGVWGSSADVGLFSVAQRTAGLVGLVLIAANVIVAPKFAELFHKNDMVTLGRVARHGALLMTVMASPVLLLFLIAPQWVMGLFGAEFTVGWSLLVIMALGQLVNVMTGSVGFLLMMTGNERSFLVMNIYSFTLNFVLSATLIPTYGAVGAAISSAASLAVVNLLRVRYIQSTMKIKIFPF